MEQKLTWLSCSESLNNQFIKEVEQELEFAFPKDYAEAIKTIDGAALKNAHVNHPKLGPVAYSRNVSLRKDIKGNIFILAGNLARMGKRIIPFANVGNGDLFCFNRDDKSIVLWKHERDECVFVCKTFTELCEMIVYDND